MRSKPTRCHVVILPPKEVSEKAIIVSRKLGNLGGSFMLDNKSHIPHITLYATDLPRKNLNIVTRMLRRELARTNRIKFVTATFHQKNDGFVDIGFQKTASILSLHKSIIRIFNPLREGISAHRERFPEFGRRERMNIMHYGYPEANALFRPHITLTRLEPRSRNKNVIYYLPKKNFSFTAKNLGLFLAGSQGTCQKMIAKFHLR